MPAKIADDEKIPKIPNLDVAQWKFFLKSHPNCTKTEEKLIAEVKAKGNLPKFRSQTVFKHFYTSVIVTIITNWNNVLVWLATTTL